MSKKVKSCSIRVYIFFQFRQTVKFWLHTRLKRPLANVVFFCGVFLIMIGARKYGLNLILTGRRIDNVKMATTVIRNIIQKKENSELGFLKLLGSGTGRPVEMCRGRILILKTPIFIDNKLIEKGAIIVKFTETFIPIYLSLNVALLSKYFRVILEPSSVGYSLPEILIWTALGKEKVIVLSPYKDDFDFLVATTANLVPMTLGPADWVDTSRFYKISDTEKIYDAIYIANFNPIKRVERYIRAVVRVTKQRPDYKVALVLASHGDAKNEVINALNCAKDRTSIDVFYDIKQAEINELVNKSKVNILVSLREGSNKGLAEGLFSGAPALLMKESVSGNHVHINAQSGRVVSNSDIEDGLLWFADNYTECTPDEWARSHIDPTVSTRILSDKLKEIEIADGRPWTKEIFAKVNRPELAYLNPDYSWLLAKRSDLLTVFSKGADEKNIIPFLIELNNDPENFVGSAPK